MVALVQDSSAQLCEAYVAGFLQPGCGYVAQLLARYTADSQIQGAQLTFRLRRSMGGTGCSNCL
jgi:hypothetical protein